MQFDKQYSSESGKIESIHRDVNSNWAKPALLFDYDTEGTTIEFRTTGDKVIFTSKEAGELVALLMNRFPGLVLDALGNV